jgi:hypothetical protein
MIIVLPTLSSNLLRLFSSG